MSGANTRQRWPAEVRQHLSNPERGIRLSAQLIEAIVHGSLEHAILQEADKGSRRADLPSGVIEGDVNVGMLLLLVHECTQPWLTVWTQLIPASLNILSLVSVQ